MASHVVRDQATGVRPGNELDDAAVESHLVTHVDGFRGPLEVCAYSGLPPPKL
jgi:cobalamin biosynthesis protein CobD/CbiB